MDVKYIIMLFILEGIKIHNINDIGRVKVGPWLNASYLTIDQEARRPGAMAENCQFMNFFSMTCIDLGPNSHNQS